MDINILVVVASAMLGGTGAKLVDVFIKRYKAKNDVSSQIRTELWGAKDDLRLTIERQHKEIELLTEKYFAAIRDRNALKVRNLQLELQIESCNCDKQ